MTDIIWETNIYKPDLGEGQVGRTLGPAILASPCVLYKYIIDLGEGQVGRTLGLAILASPCVLYKYIIDLGEGER